MPNPPGPTAPQSKEDRYQTVRGYSMYECISAMQKCIRQNDEEKAMFFAFELAESSWMFKVMLARLRIITQEDVGLGDPQAVVFALHSLQLVEMWHDSKGPWELALANAVLALSRAGKSRLADHFQAHIHGRMQERGWRDES
jgi:replication-associated recombination protein RarA